MNHPHRQVWVTLRALKRSKLVWRESATNGFYLSYIGYLPSRTSGRALPSRTILLGIPYTRTHTNTQGGREIPRRIKVLPMAPIPDSRYHDTPLSGHATTSEEICSGQKACMETALQSPLQLCQIQLHKAILAPLWLAKHKTSLVALQ